MMGTMRKVLVVDDNASFAENLVEIIEDAGIGQAAAVDSGARALELLGSEHFDALVTDMRMPKMSGAQLVHATRAIHPHLPIVVITAYSEDQQLDGVEHDGVLSILSKPAPIDRLVQLLTQARPWVVALVDDDVALVDNLVESLHDRGVTAVTAHSIDDIERLGGSPGVAIVDMRVPGGRDGAALARVAARFPQASTIIVTAFRGEVDVPADVELFEKPFDTERLLATIERLCGAQRSAR